MNYFLYDIATTLAVPFGAAYLALVPRRRSLLARLSPPPLRCPVAPVWIHACSVGELTVARPVLAGLRERYPTLPLVLSVSTQTAHDMASASRLPADLIWFPFDQRTVVARCFDALTPRVLVLMETEIWPNVLREAQHRNVPAVVLNARISDKHFARYQRHEAFFKTVFSRLARVGSQHPLYAERFASLGANTESISITGNIKFDNLTTTIEPSRLNELRRQCGIPNTATVIIFGSTRPGDEQLAAACWAQWKKQFPDAYLIIAPRHRDRLQEALIPFSDPILLRSKAQSGAQPAGERILVVDTLGELISFYALANVAIVGGSFYPGVNGHNPLEPAALGVPTIFGSYMRNFLDPAEVLVKAEAAIQLQHPEQLAGSVVALLRDPQKQSVLSANAARAIAGNAGALTRSLDLLDDTLLKFNLAP